MNASVARLVERTLYTDSGPVQHMGVNHRCGHILVAQQFLHCANVISILEQVRGERVPKCMTTRWLVG